jgi:hypothetical protein
MQSANSFVLNLKHQKSVAKKRLKAIRNGDLLALEKVVECHPKANTLSSNTMQLADVQHALARELGLASWSKLKQHVEMLQQHRQAISDHKAPLDNDAITLHVRCGHDIQGLLKEAGFEGDFLALIDPLCIGPLPASKIDFVVLRAGYIQQNILPIIGRDDEHVSHIINAENQNMATLLSDKYQRIVFWVEHDSYDQFMLVYALTQLSGIVDKVIEIIEINQFPGTERFIGLGQLPGEAIRSCWQNRKVVTPKIMLSVNRCWQALTYSEPSLLVELIQTDAINCMPNMTRALNRHLQELPHYNTGLSLTQTLALQVLRDKSEQITVSSWFAEYQKSEPLPFLGDVMFYALLMPLTQNLKPLIKLENKKVPWCDQLFSITEQGRSCLKGDSIHIQEYWVGGIHCTETSQWQWDHQQTNTLLVKRFNCD